MSRVFGANTQNVGCMPGAISNVVIGDLTSGERPFNSTTSSLMIILSGSPSPSTSGSARAQRRCGRVISPTSTSPSMPTTAADADRTQWTQALRRCDQHRPSVLSHSFVARDRCNMNGMPEHKQRVGWFALPHALFEASTTWPVRLPCGRIGCEQPRA